MKTSKKSVVLSSVQYIIIFIGFALSYMFTYPQYDVLLFTRDFKGDIVSVLREALFYGNGTSFYRSNFFHGFFPDINCFSCQQAVFQR